MSIVSHQQRALEKKLRLLCDELDHYLEDRYEERYNLHPNRPPRGKTAAVAYDGLFSTGTQFTLGIGSDYGRGYIVDIHIATLDKVDTLFKEEVYKEAQRFLNERLELYFPNRKLQVVFDKNVYKIVGNFSLGNLY